MNQNKIRNTLLFLCSIIPNACEYVFMHEDIDVARIKNEGVGGLREEWAKEEKNSMKFTRDARQKS